jgi:integration host factor subunit beta
MTRSELIRRLGQRFPQYLPIDIRVAVDEIIGAITLAVVTDTRVEIRGFGAFSLRRRNARTRRNPKTGEVFPVAAKQVPYFKAGMKLRKNVMAQPPVLPRFRQRIYPKPLPRIMAPAVQESRRESVAA